MVEATAARVTRQAAFSRALLRDRLLQVGVIVWIVTLLPSLVPILSPERTKTFAEDYQGFAPTLVLGWALVRAIRSASSPRERLFWTLLGVTIGLDTVILSMNAFIPFSTF